MKTYTIAMIAVAGSLVAAEAPQEFAFKDKLIGLPAFKLSDNAVAPVSSKPTYFSVTPTDLSALAFSRQSVKVISAAPVLIQKPVIVSLLSPTDLVCRSADVDRLVEQFNQRSQSGEKPNQSAQPHRPSGG